MSSRSRATIKLLETNRQIEKKIYEALAGETNKKIKRNRGRVKSHFFALAETWVRSSKELASLSAIASPNSLNANFGIPVSSAAEIAEDIVRAVISSYSIEISPINSKLKGNVIFNFQESSFSNLLSLTSGRVKTELGVELHWMDWLLLKGDTTIVYGYDYMPSRKGRSKGGTMGAGQAWRVPPQFSGTAGNNFITRAFENRDKEITEVLKGLFR